MTFWIIIVLVAIGLVMLGIELFMPGAVMGIVGGLVLVIAVAMSYVHYGPVVGTALVAALAVVGVIGFALWVRMFPGSRFGQRMALNTFVEGNSTQAGLHDLIGKQGVSHTLLRPAGVAVVEGRRVDVMTEGEYISPGIPITVTRVDGASVFVRATGAN